MPTHQPFHGLLDEQPVYSHPAAIRRLIARWPTSKVNVLSLIGNLLANSPEAFDCWMNFVCRRTQAPRWPRATRRTP